MRWANALSRIDNYLARAGSFTYGEIQGPDIDQGELDHEYSTWPINDLLMRAFEAQDPDEEGRVVGETLRAVVEELGGNEHVVIEWLFDNLDKYYCDWLSFSESKDSKWPARAFEKGPQFFIAMRDAFGNVWE